jgi:hypothetical protein
LVAAEVDVLIVNAGYDPRYDGLHMTDAEWLSLLPVQRRPLLRHLSGVDLRSLAEAMGPHGIRVNAVVPGWTMTERQLEQWVTPEAKAQTNHRDGTAPSPAPRPRHAEHPR